jgi:hypothetical protein
MPYEWEVKYGLKPLVNDANEDPDNDSLTNMQEYATKTNPKNPDSDGDGMTDGWEVTYGLDPLGNDASGDKDGDGYSNIEKYINSLK